MTSKKRAAPRKSSSRKSPRRTAPKPVTTKADTAGVPVKVLAENSRVKYCGHGATVKAVNGDGTFHLAVDDGTEVKRAGAASVEA